MRIRSPTSRGSFRLRLSAFDAVWALLSPWLALLFRDPNVLLADRGRMAALYCVISFAFSIIAFLSFRIRDGMSRYFSVHDALDVAKAVILSELMTCLVLFTFTRLDGIPRSTLLIHALVLAAGLVAARTAMRILDRDSRPAERGAETSAEHIVMIGATQLTSHYIKLLEAYAPGRRKVVAVLDGRPDTIGGSVAGVRVMGPPEQLESFIDEYTEHGIRLDRVIVGGEPDLLAGDALDGVERICARREIKLDFVPSLIGLAALKADPATAAAAMSAAAPPIPRITPSRYFRIKRLFDFLAAAALLLLLLPLFLLVAITVLIDVGSPVLFWQQRIGAGGRNFLLHKFRTLKPAYDWRGQPVPDDDRLSVTGSVLRRMRLDELPQLLNVLVGDMSLVGPRPLLPHDQPDDPAVRLMVRPGITGWAQVNGAQWLTSDQKNHCDEWYIANASLGLDLRILAMTVGFVLRRALNLPAAAPATRRFKRREQTHARPAAFGQDGARAPVASKPR